MSFHRYKTLKEVRVDSAPVDANFDGSYSFKVSEGDHKLSAEFNGRYFELSFWMGLDDDNTEVYMYVDGVPPKLHAPP